MAMTTCSECKASISDTADVCPQCGYRKPAPKKFKWWLWGPLGLVGLFFAYGASIPRYESDALAARNLCEQMIGGRGSPLQFQCDANYSDAIAKGRNSPRSRDSNCPPEAPGCSWGK